RLEPGVDRAVLGAVLDPLGARAEPTATMRAIEAEATAAGVAIETGRTVMGLAQTTAGSWEVRTATAEMGADAVVLAAGAWTGRVAALAGIRVPIVAVQGQMWAAPLPPGSLRHAIAAAESALAWSGPEAGLERPPFLTHRDGHRLTRHLYGRQRFDGEVVFGGDRVLRPDPSFRRGRCPVDDAGIAVNHRHVAELVPAMATTTPVRTWSGLMPFTVDGRPMLGAVPDRPGLFVAGGLASSGFGRGPMAGELVARIVLGQDPGVDLSIAGLDERVAELES
ncbi:MAG: FAD-binding oxidoreductase, partial [Acidimicrobiia bacterium]|nr:FAD-binding oxidoreductase [Acidimicrobiia bacterium]